MTRTQLTIQSDIELANLMPGVSVNQGADIVIAEGAVPATLEVANFTGIAFAANSDRFILHVPRGASFLVENGRTITYARNGASDNDLAAFLMGPAWAAVCYQRGLLPLHASAVLHQGKVHAFTGASGAGKSTLAAALADRGLPVFTDDLLIIDPDISDATEIACFTSLKNMKLWPETLKLVAAAKLHPVRDAPGFEKFYFAPSHSAQSAHSKLASLTVLRNENIRRGREPFVVAQIAGAMAIRHLRDSVYRSHFAQAIWGRERLFKTLARLIPHLQLQSFDRPLNPAFFEASTAAMEQWIIGGEQGQ